MFFKTQRDFRDWLAENHDTSTEIWVGFWKKASGNTGMNYDESVDEALCFGWIDGRANSYDERSYMQRFTPRRAKSVWSRVNTHKVERLIKEKKMMPPGLIAVNLAKEDGRWKKAYDSPANAKVPADFLDELRKNKAAFEFFKTLNKSNIYHVAYQLQNAKKEVTRIRRMKTMIEKLARREKFH